MDIDVQFIDMKFGVNVLNMNVNSIEVIIENLNDLIKFLRYPGR